jgi:alkylhydroperoxidase family enzyme
MRYFRCSSDMVYEHARATLDLAWGHPNPQTQTITCVDPSAVAPRDSVGRILLSLKSEFCEYEAAAALLPELLATGTVEEINAAEYTASLREAATL